MNTPRYAFGSQSAAAQTATRLEIPDDWNARKCYDALQNECLDLSPILTDALLVNPRALYVGVNGLPKSSNIKNDLIVPAGRAYALANRINVLVNAGDTSLNDEQSETQPETDAPVVSPNPADEAIV